MTKARPVAPAVVITWGMVIFASIVAIPFLDQSKYPNLFLTCVAIAASAYIRILFYLDRVRAMSRQALVVSLALAGLWRLPLLLRPPTLSSDIYRYVWDGRIQRLGYNPYLVVPSDREYRQLHTPETRLMNHPDLPTPYPAGAELFFRAVAAVQESALAMKLAFVVCDAALVVVLLKWLIGSGRNPWWVLAYAWNPLVILEGAGNGHVDLLGVLCMTLTEFAMSHRRSTIAVLALAFGIAVKFLPVVLLPVFWRRVRMRDSVFGLALLTALYLPFLTSGVLPVGSFGAYLSWWRVNGPLYGVLEHALPNVFLMAIPVGAGLAVAGWARWHWAIEAPETWAWPIAVALLFAPTVFPWYLLWLTPFLFSTGTVPLAVWSVGSLMLYSSLPAFAVTRIEYGGVAIAAGWMVVQRYDLTRFSITVKAK
jgi:hypothetical protein